MMNQGYRCALHQQNFQFYCQRCLQPVCKQCTVIGPHHTQIHSISKINIAYEKKVEQIKCRIDELIERNREKVFRIICQLNEDIEKIDTIKSSIEAENNKQKQRMILNLMKQYQNNLNILHLYRQNLISKSNEINDLGYRYENIQNPIELLGSHNKIMQELKELHDRVEIILQKKIQPKPFTKQLTEIRIKLKQIESLSQLYQQKLKVIQLLIKKTKQLKKSFGAPPLDYESLLFELNRHLSSINHLVCNFCGLSFSFDEANKQCLKNNTNLNLNFDNKQQSGFCKVSPDTNKLGTHRHYFGEPANPLLFYGQQAQNSFKVQIEGLLLKTKALSKYRDINIKRKFQSNDKLKNGQCEKIVFDYIFIEQLGLSEKEKQIIMTLAKKSQTNPSFYSYSQIVEKLEAIDV